MEKVILCILDGYGIRKEPHGNAIKAARTPIFNKLREEYGMSLLDASGLAVGLPKGQMGNSEVGHLNIGAGRVVDQPLQFLAKRIKNKSFFKNEKLNEVVSHVKANNSKLHIMGLLSDGGVHSHIDHILALLKLAKINKIEEVYFHMFLDGRDTLKDVAYNYIRTLEKEIKKQKTGKIATISGRFYGMDRDKRWERIKPAYDAIVFGNGELKENIKELLDRSYMNGIYDEFIYPTVINRGGEINDNDGIIFANFRPDRASEIMYAITNPSFNEFETKKLKDIKAVTMMPISNVSISKPAFSEIKPNNTLGEYIAKLGYKQLRIAETEKYAHVTYFFDGGEDKMFDNENRILVASPKDVQTYDQKPEMSAGEITDKLLVELDNNYDLVVINYANCDMVGHTGNFDAAVIAVETVDTCLGKLYEKAIDLGYKLVIIADHGNAEYMLDKGVVITSHSLSRVPLIICDKKYKTKNGKLSDIAPTILKIMNLEKPEEMTGKILIK